MPISLGLDIGSNSVGSAWIDTDHKIIQMGVSVFPAGVDEQENKRGAPKNQARRLARSQRRTIDRRAWRKRKLITFLKDHGFLPIDATELQRLFDLDPWHLRRKALQESLTPFQLGRVLVHMAQRRGAFGITTDPDDPEEGKVKEGMDRLAKAMKENGALTVGQFIADRIDKLGKPIARAADEACSRRTLQRRRLQAERWKARGVPAPEPRFHEPVRNRHYRMAEDQQFFAGRELIREEFSRIVEMQRSMRDSRTAEKLTEDLIRQLDDPKQTNTWRHYGLLFGQRRTYWDTGTLGRCSLEPTDRCVPIADASASYYRVLETVNNIRITERGETERPLSVEERDKVIAALRGKPYEISVGKGKRATIKLKQLPKDVKPNHIREVLGIDQKSLDRRGLPKDFFLLNIEKDEDRDINTDWFYREIVHGVFTEPLWAALQVQQRDSVNQAILKFDPDNAEDAQKLRNCAVRWWSLGIDESDQLVQAWKQRPRLEKRLNLSRRAILNLLPYMERFDQVNNRWPTQQEARLAHARILRDRFERDGEVVDQIAADRYSTGALGLSAADRHYMRLSKHQIKDKGEVVFDLNGKPLAMLPPAPMISNPVVRKAIHEVRRHLLAYLRKFFRKPDHVVIEFARGVKDTAKQRNLQLSSNRAREEDRKLIEKNLRAWGIPESNWKQAILRVRLCREQNGICPFSLEGPNANRTISEKLAAEGREVELEHIVPEALTGKTMKFNHLVLCFREANRKKGMQSPLEWLGSDKLQVMLQRLEKAPIRNNRIKWERLQAATPNEEAFRNSQLTDTAYAARQVAAYIADALFEGKGLPERGGKRKIYTTKGEFTARLRADWGLHESTIDLAHGLERPPTSEALQGDPGLEQSWRRARKEPKDRSDHRHHAVDALAIAMVGPKLLTDLGQMAREDREYRERTGRWPRRKAVDPPSAWNTVESFHEDVYRAFENLAVSHCPVKRRLASFLHKQTLYGPTFNQRGQRIEDRVTIRQPIYESPQSHLKPVHLRLAKPETRDQAIKRLAKRFRDSGLKVSDARKQALLVVDTPSFRPRLVEPSPEKAGIVRDPALRNALRNCLKDRGLDPDAFTGTELKASLERDGYLQHVSGVPIKSAVLLWANNDPVVIHRRKWNAASKKMEPDLDPRTLRLYDSQNNHHIEIRERQVKTKGTVVTQWFGEVIKNIDAANRNAARLKELKAAGIPSSGKLRQLSKAHREKFRSIIGDINQRFQIVNRSPNDNGTFVMSLAQGEMIYMKHPTTGVLDYFVIFKIDKSGRVHFAHHWDARLSNPREDQERNKIPDTQREDIDNGIVPDTLKILGPEPGQPPYKVQVGPLGQVRRIND
jgi:CRISPR-associated endonuclease Csn1